MSIVSSLPLLLSLVSTVTILPLPHDNLFFNISTTHSFDNNATIVSWMSFTMSRHLVAETFTIAQTNAATVTQASINSYYDQSLTAVLACRVHVLPCPSQMNVTSIPLLSSSSSSSSSGSSFSSSFSSTSTFSPPPSTAYTVPGKFSPSNYSISQTPLNSNLVFPYQIYVDSDAGVDSNTGLTLQSPLQTITAAQALARSLLAHNASQNLIVLLNGDFYLTSPITFSALDSPTYGHVMMYSSVDRGQPATLNGGVVLPQSWSLYNETLNIWRLDVSHLAVPTFRNLFMNGQRLEKARVADWPLVSMVITQPQVLTDSGCTPNDHTNVFDCSTNCGLPPNLAAPVRMEMAIWYAFEFYICQVNISTSYQMAIDPECYANIFSFVAGGGNTIPLTYLSDSLLFLNVLGTWVSNRGDGYIYYIPHVGQDVNSLTFVAPQLQTWWDLTSGASNIVFDTLVFQYSDWQQPSTPLGLSVWQADFTWVPAACTANRAGNSTYPLSQLDTPGWGVSVPPAVTCVGCQNVTFLSNIFTHMGTAAIRVGTQSYKTLLYNNSIYDISASGIQVFSTNFYNNPILYTSIQSNTIHDVGAEYPTSPAIFNMWSGLTLIDHNALWDLPSMGIENGMGWYYHGSIPTMFANRITNNLIYHYMLLLQDGGCIYLNSDQSGTYVGGNYCYDAYQGASEFGAYPYQETVAFYFDEQTNNVVFDGNNIGLNTNNIASFTYLGQNTVGNNITIISSYGTANAILANAGSVTLPNFIPINYPTSPLGTWLTVPLVSNYPGGYDQLSATSYILTGSGNDFYSTSNVFQGQALFQILPGDFTFSTQIIGVNKALVSAIGGIFATTSISQLTSSNSISIGLSYYEGSSVGEYNNPTFVSLGVFASRQWYVQLSRLGSIITMSYSATGLEGSYSSPSSNGITFAGNVYVGFFSASHLESQYANAYFTNVSLITSAISSSSSATPVSSSAYSSSFSSSPLSSSAISSTSSPSVSSMSSSSVPGFFISPSIVGYTAAENWMTLNFGTNYAGSYTQLSPTSFAVNGSGSNFYATDGIYAGQAVYQDISTNFVFYSTAFINNTNIASNKAGIFVTTNLGAMSSGNTIGINMDYYAGDYKLEGDYPGYNTIISFLVQDYCSFILIRTGNVMSLGYSLSGGLTSFTYLPVSDINFVNTVTVGMFVTSYQDGNYTEGIFMNTTLLVPNVTYTNSLPLSTWETQPFGTIYDGSVIQNASTTFIVTGSGREFFAGDNIYQGQALFQFRTGDFTLTALAINPYLVYHSQVGLFVTQNLQAMTNTNTVGIDVSYDGESYTLEYNNPSWNSLGVALDQNWQYLRVSRSGTTVTLSYSSDGNTFNSLGANDLSFAGTMAVGMFVDAGAEGTFSTGIFEQVLWS